MPAAGLFETVRTTATARTWSRGVELARSETAVHQAPAPDPDERIFHVKAAGELAARTVSLWPDDADWSCDCNHSEDVCPHAAAAVIAWRRQKDQPTPTAAASAQSDQTNQSQKAATTSPQTAANQTIRIHYHFKRTPKGLHFERRLGSGSQAKPFTASLIAIAKGRTKSNEHAHLVSTQTDLNAELALGSSRQGVLPRATLAKLLQVLRQEPVPVSLDNAMVTIDRAEPTLRAYVDTCPEGFQLFVEQNHNVCEVFANGAVLTRQQPTRAQDVPKSNSTAQRNKCTILRPLKDPGLTSDQIAELRRGKVFAWPRAGDLVTSTLPGLQQHIPVTIRTSKLPRLGSLPLRVQFETYTEQPQPPQTAIATPGEATILSILPTLVYGADNQSAAARVDGDRLTYLGGDVLPKRQRQQESDLREAVLERFGISVGQRRQWRGAAAVKLLQQVAQWDKEAITGSGQHAFRLRGTVVPSMAESTATNAIPNLTFMLPTGIDDGSAIITDSSTSTNTSTNTSTGSAGGAAQATPEAVFQAWQNQEAVVPLTDGTWAELPTDWLSQYGPVLQNYLALKAATTATDGATSTNTAVPGHAAFDLAALYQSLNTPPPPDLRALYENATTLLTSDGTLPPAKLPQDLTATLRHYQQDGVNWLNFHAQANMGALLADDMGLGKTLQTICILQGRCLIVAPTSVLFNWQSEIKRFRPSLSTQLYHGPNRRLDANAQVTLTTYAILRRDLDNLLSSATQPWDVVVLDEAQAIKNPQSQVSQAAYALTPHAKTRIALTGTPIENRLDELWSQFHFLNPGLLLGRQGFQERYTAPIQNGSPEALAQLRQRIKPFMLRRLKSQVAPELPPRTENVLHCLLSDDERKTYDAVAAATRKEVMQQLQGTSTETDTSEGKGKGKGKQKTNVLKALEALLRLRQACCHPALIPGQAAQHATSPSAKTDVLVDTLDKLQAEGNKSLVFSQWTQFLDLLEPQLEQAGIPFTRLDGSTKDRGAIVDTFQSQNGPPVMLISLKAGGTGLNLTAADHVFLMDPWWNPAVEDQAADRAHRIGQTKPVMIHRMVAKNTVEERILDLQAHKRSLAKAALEDAPGTSPAATTLTKDDLLQLIEG